MKRTDLRPGMVVAVYLGGKAELGQSYADRCMVVDASQPWRLAAWDSGVRYEPGIKGHRRAPQYALAKARPDGTWEPTIATAVSILGTWDDHLDASERRETYRAAEQQRRLERDVKDREWAAATTARLASLGIDRLAHRHQRTSGLTFGGEQLERLLTLAEAGANSGGSRDAFLAAHADTISRLSWVDGDVEVTTP